MFFTKGQLERKKKTTNPVAIATRFLPLTPTVTCTKQEEDKKMRMLAVIPPMMLDARQRRLRFLNNNGLLEDPMAAYKEQLHLNHWTEQEKQVFKEKYLQHPKNFPVIASFLPRKVSLYTSFAFCYNILLPLMLV